MSASKIKLVEEAAKELGYQLNYQAKVLRQGASQKVFVLIPLNSVINYRELVTTISSTHDNIFDIEIKYLDESQSINDVIDGILSYTPKAVVCVGIDIDQRNDGDTAWIFIDCMTSFGQHINFNKNQIQEHLKKISELSKQKILIKPTESLYWDKLLEGEDIKVISNQGNYYSLYSKINHLCKYDLIIVTDVSVYRNLKEIYTWFNNDNLPKFVLLGQMEDTNLNSLDTIRLNYSLISNELRNYLSHNKSPKIIDVIPLYKSFDLKKALSKNRVIEILILKSPMSKALNMIKFKYLHDFGIQLNITEKNHEEIEAICSNQQASAQYDIIRIDMALSSKVSRKIFIELDKYTKIEEINSRIPSYVSDEYKKIDNIQLTMPFDISSQVLVYRKDLFENTLIQREYFERNKNELTPPKTFDDFDKISKFFTRTFNENSRTTFGHSLAQKTELVAFCDFMPRFRERSSNSKNEVLDLEEIVLDYIDSSNYAPKNINNWWGDVVLNLINGTTAMEIVFSNYISTLFLDGNNTEHQYGFTTVPGKYPLLGGGCLGIVNTSKQINECMKCLDWLYSDDISKILAYLGGVLPTTSVLTETKLISLYPWLNNYENIFSNGSRSQWGRFKTDIDFEYLLGREIRQKFNSNSKY
ncbi:extracellular solute-binding protein [Aerococcaceae bacterium zg-BR9]|nr:extracellular solute-binding protein [Aerococcaceae bacterium zg-BR9]MBF6977832.1 extracellular solute-binding protein [Aerococcaceae bacterium zg-BR22]